MWLTIKAADGKIQKGSAWPTGQPYTSPTT